MHRADAQEHYRSAVAVPEFQGLTRKSLGDFVLRFVRGRVGLFFEFNSTNPIKPVAPIVEAPLLFPARKYKTDEAQTKQS
jgi:hypothetical protein